MQLRALTKSDHHIADFLVGEIVDQLPEHDRDAAFAPSVITWFDTQMATELVGPDVGPVLAELQRRRLLVSIGDRPDARRYHPLLRELLQSELKWRDQQRLHPSASRGGGDLAAAG